MINKDNFKALLRHLDFEEKGQIFSKDFEGDGIYLKADFKKEKLEYPESAGLTINERQTCDFHQAENAVVFECVHKLLDKGYKPKHIELEPKWKLGHGASGGRADILVKDQKDKPILIIECKTFGKEFEKAWKETLDDGGQLFSYAQQISETDFLCLYASEFNESENQLLVEQRIISHKDNDKILEQGDKLQSFKKASNVKKRYDVWKDTYQLEYTETGIFEDNIQAYQIGKSKYTLDIDTRPVTDKDKEGKYHRFRTILRQHNIARKETAFEVLVNLFLSKIVDEEENKTDLEFYWKGVAYDNYYDFVDRLQKLYQIGMRKFLNDEIMYISNDQIDSAFWTVKNKRNATKKQIQKYFRDLKFFSNNAFSFINVHNERLFNKNAKVLVEIVQMWQGLRLKTKEQNQFLGDMFEFFLDNSIKQSEGQFFTPMPITKFIVMSLPLEDKIQQSSEPLKAIDYACGAGHFLTEYAHQIKPLVEKYKETEVSKYYENIVGIEKEDRLAKVAKVSAYMYGQDQIKILEEDALSDIAEIKPETFDVLIANPPFAVEGFLHNLTEKQKEQYELIQTTGLNSNTSNIQCFFIERAKQIMSPGGTVGIIVPSSVLSNSDTTHIGTREIILKFFDIVSIVELGSGTFGKTGTNTVVLFLRRKEQKPEPAEHYKNRVDDYFEIQLADVLAGKKQDDELAEYQDLGLIRKYCEQTELPFDEYIKLFGITSETYERLEELLKTDIFKEYRNDFDNSTDIKNLQKKKFFKDKTKEQKEEELNKRFIKYLFEIEKNKLYYFMLAYENKQKVLIVKSPNDNKEQKQFLGYEWSGAKGSEGIQYKGGSTVNDIITPLFDPKNINNTEKINYLIQQNFIGAKPNLKGFESLEGLITYAKVSDILDFTRKDFNKAFSLTPKIKIEIATKWELVKLGNVVNISIGGTPSRKIFDYFGGENLWVSISEMNEQIITDTKEKITDAGVKNSNVKLIPKNTTLLSFKLSIGKTAIAGKDLYTNEAIAGLVPKDNNKISDAFLYQLFTSKIIDLENTGNKAFGKSLNSAFLRDDVKIPLPPKKVQQQIVSECEAIDKKAEQANATIEKAKKEIEEKIQEVYKTGFTEKRLSEISLINPSKRELKDLDEDTLVSFVEMASVSDEGYISEMVDRPYKDLKKGSYTYFAEGDIIYAKITPCMENGKCALAKGLTNGIALGSSEFHVFRTNEDVLNSFVFALLNRDVLRKDAEKNMTGSSGHRRVPANYFANTKIPVPSIAEQKKLISAIEKQELKIKEAQQIIENVSDGKQAVMEKYL